jgi:hypothetical protein
MKIFLVAQEELDIDSVHLFPIRFLILSQVLLVATPMILKPSPEILKYYLDQHRLNL